MIIRKKKPPHNIVSIDASSGAVHVETSGSLKDAANLAHSLHADLVQRMSQTGRYVGKDYG